MANTQGMILPQDSDRGPSWWPLHSQAFIEAVGHTLRHPVDLALSDSNLDAIRLQVNGKDGSTRDAYLVRAIVGW
ncbi:hypothetical protein PILCRDRAFT_824198 [Piloderma croceum F 1598]|uniref:Uncharacterized protein n=1 Tax=Piloderma croceum (strain F 1598) TaxID=765440 RepID=A0A0C3FFQ2_PILCF|nr:hypothetical protein PILCRDRAFT_824198 [Piloderma croceum F 1598]